MWLRDYGLSLWPADYPKRKDRNYPYEYTAFTRCFAGVLENPATVRDPFPAGDSHASGSMAGAGTFVANFARRFASPTRTLAGTHQLVGSMPSSTRVYSKRLGSVGTVHRTRRLVLVLRGAGAYLDGLGVFGVSRPSQGLIGLGDLLRLCSIISQRMKIGLRFANAGPCQSSSSTFGISCLSCW